MQIKDDFLGILQDYIDFPVEEIVTDMPFKAASGVDSYMMIEMIAAVEEHFGIKIPNRDIMQLKTVDDMVGYIQMRLATAARA